MNVSRSFSGNKVAYLGTWKTSTIEVFAKKIIKSYKHLTILASSPSLASSSASDIKRKEMLIKEAR